MVDDDEDVASLDRFTNFFQSNPNYKDIEPINV